MTTNKRKLSLTLMTLINDSAQESMRVHESFRPNASKSLNSLPLSSLPRLNTNDVIIHAGVMGYSNYAISTATQSTEEEDGLLLQ